MMRILYIKTTPAFDKLAQKSITHDAREKLFDFLLANPKAGDLIPGTGGVRKLRWKTGCSGKGKRGGSRILYLYEREIIIILITLYLKGDQENISAAEKNKLKKLIPQLVEKYLEELDDE
ncbi:MAG: type II toxin-antitoxin system RelE/ParE family toxin [Legionellales bacterium]|nr:type II toxin-antitoxin system RelE/ParE family toxin [Legionellales bacterium]